MNRPLAQLLVALVLAAMMLVGLIAWNPFGHLKALITGSSPSREEARVNNYYTDPATQEVSYGQTPLRSLHLLEGRWCADTDGPRYVMTGNSQMMTTILAPSESLSGTAERTYPDILLDRLVQSGFRGHGYRLSAPNVSYMEVLWYLTYLVTHPCLKPDEFVVQLNFETFRKTGIRDGMLELLEDPKFNEAISREARIPQSYTGVLQQAIDRYHARIAKQSAAQSGAAATSRTGLAESAGFGGILETRVREQLESAPLFASRGTLKPGLLDVLYLMRVNLLGITPATKRSLGGGTLTANISALNRIGKLCREHGIRLVFFDAPQNPNAPLYRTAADREQYRQIVAELVRTDGRGYFDFEGSIPGPLWGVWVDGPDPIHFGRAAHRQLADLMFESNVIPSGR